MAPAHAEDGPLARVRRLIAISNFADAERVLRDYLKAEPASANAHYLLGYTLLRLNNPTASLAEYTRAAQLRTPTGEDLRSVAQDYVLLDDYPDADIWITRSVAMNDRDPDSWYVMGRIRYARQNFESAVACFQKTLAMAPQSVKAGDNLGLAYEGLNRVKDAIAAYRQALAWQQGAAHPSEQPMLNLAIVLMHQGGEDEALGLLTRAVAIAPKDPKIREQLGHLYLERKQLPQAQHEFEEAVALVPDSAAYHFLLGQVYRRQGMQTPAQSQFARAAALNGSRSTPGKN